MKQKLAVIGFSYLFALIIASFINYIAVGALAAAAIITAVILSIFKKKTAAVVTFTGAAALGIFFIYTVNFINPVVNSANQTIFITGTVLEKGLPLNDNSSYVIEAKINNTKAKISFFGSDTNAEIGDNISFEAKLYLPVNSSAFPEKSYLSSKGIFLKATPKGSINVNKNSEISLKKLIYSYSDFINSKVKNNISGDVGGFISALFFGDKNGLSYELENNISRSGISHLTAVSGLHLTLIVHIFMLFIGATKIRKNVKLKFTVLAILIALFMIFFKLSPSVIRSGIMLIIFYGAELFGRKSSTLNSLGAAILIIILPEPYACLDVGFLMSVCGTFGVGVLAPLVTKKDDYSALKSVKDMLMGTICALFCTLPLSVIFFGGISIVSPVTNIILVPFFTVILFLLLIFTITGGFFTIILTAAGAVSNLAVMIINFIGNIKFVYLPLPYNFILPVLVLCFVFTALIYGIFKNPVKTKISIIFSLITVVLCIFIYGFLNKDVTKVEIIPDNNNFILYASGKENIIAYTKYTSEVDILKANSFGDIREINLSEKEIINISGTEILVSSVKEETNVPYAIGIYYDYKKSVPKVSAYYSVFINKNQKQIPENSKNAYFEQTVFYISEKGLIKW